MQRLLISFILVVSVAISTGLSQGFQPPSEGKAVVYFTRVTAYGGAISFEFFHQDKFIGVFKGKNYMRYECDPGEQLFWASSENKEFLTADVEAGKTYIIVVNVIMGAWKARVGLEPIDEKHKVFPRALKLINKKKPVVTSRKKIEKTTRKLAKRNFIFETLEKYETSWKHKHNFRHISKDMSIPESEMK